MQEEYKRAIRTFVANSTPTADKEKIIKWIQAKTGYVLPPVSVKKPKDVIAIITNVRELAREHSAIQKAHYEKLTQCRVIKNTQINPNHTTITTFSYQHILSKEPISPENYAILFRRAHTHLLTLKPCKQCKIC